MVRRGLARSRSEARHLIETGKVSVAGIPRPKPATTVAADSMIELDSSDRFASRAGVKLAAALDAFEIPVAGKNALDAGASTGGFTDCLLRRGASHVAAVDVGRDQLRSDLRRDPRVTVCEGVNISSVDVADIGGPFDLVVADLSFTSLCLVAPALCALAKANADVIALVKPQFEVGKALVGKGVIGDRGLRLAAVDKVTHCFGAAGLDTVRTMESPITGEHGNQEYLLWARTGTGR